MPHTASQRIVSCAQKLSTNADALRILLNSLVKVQESPHDERYRKVPLSSQTVQRAIVSPAGAMELMYQIGFQPMYGHLVLQRVDESLLKTAIAALRKQMAMPSYHSAMEAEDRRRAQNATERQAADEKAAQRAALAAKVPNPPLEGEAGSTLICFHMDGGRDSNPIWRRFCASDTLTDLLNFARSLPEAPLELKLKQITTHPYALLEEGSCRRTLQSLDLWPSGHLQICSAA